MATKQKKTSLAGYNPWLVAMSGCPSRRLAAATPHARRRKALPRLNPRRIVM